MLNLAYSHAPKKFVRRVGLKKRDRLITMKNGTHININNGDEYNAKGLRKFISFALLQGCRTAAFSLMSFSIASAVLSLLMLCNNWLSYETLCAYHELVDQGGSGVSALVKGAVASFFRRLCFFFELALPVVITLSRSSLYALRFRCCPSSCLMGGMARPPTGRSGLL